MREGPTPNPSLPGRGETESRASPWKLPSLKGRGRGWVGAKRPLCHHPPMQRVDPEMTRRARALRTNATRAERTMWHLLSCYRPKFTRQLVEGPFILDLACRAARLAVEIDGGQHADNRRDAARTTWLESEGWSVIRFWNSDVSENAAGVAEAILSKAAGLLERTHPQPLPSREGRKRKPRASNPLPGREG